MDWHDLEALIKDERKAGNPVAQLIHSLQVGVVVSLCAGRKSGWERTVLRIQKVAGYPVA